MSNYILNTNYIAINMPRNSKNSSNVIENCLHLASSHHRCADQVEAEKDAIKLPSWSLPQNKVNKEAWPTVHLPKVFDQLRVKTWRCSLSSVLFLGIWMESQSVLNNNQDLVKSELMSRSFQLFQAHKKQYWRIRQMLCGPFTIHRIGETGFSGLRFAELVWWLQHSLAKLEVGH